MKLVAISDEVAKPMSVVLREAIELRWMFHQDKLRSIQELTQDEAEFWKILNIDGPRDPSGKPYHAGRSRRRKIKDGEVVT